MKRFLSIVLLIVILMHSSITVFAADSQIETDNIKQALQLINEKIILEMQMESFDNPRIQNEYDSIIKEMDRRCIKKMTQEDVGTFIDIMMETEQHEQFAEDMNMLSSNSDLPPFADVSTGSVDFYWVRDLYDGKWVYSVISSPVPNAINSGNIITKNTDAKKYLGSSLMDYVHIYVDKTIGQIPIIGWAPYEVFTDLLFNSTQTSELDMYEVTLITRAVHQFIYAKNSYDEWVYYGSANCINVNVEEIARRYVGAVLKTSPRNNFYTVAADNYYDWARICHNTYPTGMGVHTLYSFIYGVGVTSTNGTIISHHVNCCYYPHQALN